MKAHKVISVLAALALAACTQPKQDSGIASAGGGGANPPSAGANRDAENDGYDGLKLAKCLRDQGIPADDPASAQEKPQIPESITKEQVDAAMKNCMRFAPNYGKEPPPLDPATLDLLRRFAACMREQGVEWEDPDPSGKHRPPPPEQDPSKRHQDGQAMIDAAKICNEKVPGTGITIENGDGTKTEPQ